MKKVITASMAAILLVWALLGGSGFSANAAETNAGASNMALIARGIILPEFKLDAVPLMEALRQLSAASKQQDPGHKGINLLVKDATTTNVSPTITLDLKNVTVAEAAERLAETAGYHVSAKHFALVLIPEPNVPTLRISPEDVVPGSVMPFQLASNNFAVRWTFSDAGAKKMLAFREGHEGQKTSVAIGDFFSPPGEPAFGDMPPASAIYYAQWKVDWLKHPTDKMFVKTWADADEISLGLQSR